MSLSFGHEFLSIPGPSAMPERVLRAMHRASPNIYEGELVDMMPDLEAGLRRVARTDGHVSIYIGNGHAAWEASLANTLSRGDKVLLLTTGRFGPGWGMMARGMGIDVEILDFGTAAPTDAARVEARLRADTGHDIKAVLTVHTDTASSVRNDIPAIRAAMNAAAHPALLMVDCIASLACEPFETDAWGVDVMVAACQKGLMTPAGLAFTFHNDKAAEARKSADLVTPYWDWNPRSAPDMFYQRFCGTAPTHHLYGLREALAILAEEGIENTWARHATLAKAVWAAVDAWAEGGIVAANVTDRAARSIAVTTLRTKGEEATAIRKWTQGFAGVTLGVGLGLEAGGKMATAHGADLFRIGHMGHLNPHALLGTLSVTDAALKALDIPHGDAALSRAAQVIAEAGAGFTA
ncbi:alanine-glyoxylate transaminase/serine-glyoxylate transaminase/serine-pyruvate transaminase [Rubricella aquisinus]|uniref:Alanine-glyoxylate transaminase/serine-glyoxylate transaminase/serine-pyruvate transaminase n=1 Tax=Rubricella aquisinus TaxID=2028108 RepID=A0A840X5Z3_9RHOB|nr:aminotransferase class V-fold PLP-dependent enzyme [Rubricella aquisinus]MBB5517196.1 alanine-glyoxylate transaminase/serine-glyoxylate transaminase/serine-pyruvate transaminase [Rubricella aquisinus]